MVDDGIIGVQNHYLFSRIGACVLPILPQRICEQTAFERTRVRVNYSDLVNMCLVYYSSTEKNNLNNLSKQEYYYPIRHQNRLSRQLG